MDFLSASSHSSSSDSRQGAADQAANFRGSRNVYLSPLSSYVGDRSASNGSVTFNGGVGKGGSLTINNTNLPQGFLDALTANSAAQNDAINSVLSSLSDQQTSNLNTVASLATNTQTGGIATLLKYVIIGVVASLGIIGLVAMARFKHKS